VWEYAGYTGPVVLTGEQSTVMWEFVVPETVFTTLLWIISYAGSEFCH